MIQVRRIPLTTWLTASVLVLLPVLAALQYRWLSAIGDETAGRMRAIAESAAVAMSADLAFEVNRAWRQRAEAGGSAVVPSDSAPLVKDALVFDGLETTAPLRVRRWNLETGACEPAGWPVDYGSPGTEGHHLVDLIRRRSASLAVVPIDLPDAGAPDRAVRPPCAVAGRGLLVFRLDAAVLRRSLLPEVARRHLDVLQRENFRIAIVSGAGRRDVVYAPAGTDVSAVVARPDLAIPLTLVAGNRPGRGGRGGAVGRRGGAASENDEGPGMRGRQGEPDDGWTLVAQHRAGSLEAAIAGLRARNLGISFGILLLMGVAVALIGANARKAERLGKQQVEFVAAVSHEMRTPVTAIDLAARNLEDGVVADAARVKRYGGIIRGEARRLAETVERVLQFAALEAGRGVGPAKEIDLPAAVQEVVSRARADNPGAALELEVVGDFRGARGDADAVRSAMLNLLGNAFKYGGQPAWAKLRVERISGASPEVRVTVEDRGPGIDARDLPHVFEPFYRGRLAVERRAPGNGLGLHIVKRSIESLGGRVSLKTGRDGTAITLHMPVGPAAPTNDGESTTPAAGRG